MIGHLKGEVLHLANDHLILDVGGVGYLLYPVHSVMRQTSIGETLALWVEMEVKQEQILLFGFGSLEEKRWFKILQGVQGVGAKLAIAMLSMLSPSELIKAILDGDKASLQRTPGVGGKLATRLVTELKEKAIQYAEQYSVALANQNDRSASGGLMELSKDIEMLKDATSALVNLGFQKNDVDNVLRTVLEKENVLELQELIRMGLQILAKGARGTGG